MDHLHELREFVGAAPRIEPSEISACLGENYVRSCTKQKFAGDDLKNLLAMTSFVAGASEEARAAAEDLKTFTTTIDLIVSTHRVWLGTGDGTY